MTPAQCRAGRALLGISQDQLAAMSGVAKRTIVNFESEQRAPYGKTLEALRASLESAGVIFVDANGQGAGVRLRRVVAIEVREEDEDPSPA